MPISGGKYVSPTWHNNAAPALDAAELQAMTDTIESNDEAVASLQEAISGGFKVGFGSYVGTGEKARTLTFDYAPKMVSIFAYLYTNGVFVTSTYLQFFTQEWYDTISYISQNGSDNGKITNCSWDSTGKKFTFHDNTSSTGQDFNRSGYTYYFFYIY